MDTGEIRDTANSAIVQRATTAGSTPVLIATRNPMRQAIVLWSDTAAVSLYFGGPPNVAVSGLQFPAAAGTLSFNVDQHGAIAQCDIWAYVAFGTPSIVVIETIRN